ncbi:MAG: ribonuclease PH [Elusimicrobia bacterium]|nr:ribonuclease PH [Elusimicrobiota bacterium]
MKKTPLSLRPIRLQKSYAGHAEGSCLVSMGKTTVLCIATVEDKVPPHAEAKGTGWITAEYAMLPRAGEHRSDRSRVTTGGRVQEISRLVGRSLRAAFDLTALGPRTITVDCDVLRADGGTRTASINGGFVAAFQAMQLLVKKRQLAAIPLREFVAAVSVGLCNDKPTVDLCYVEDRDADADVNLVMTESGKFVEIQGTGEGRSFSPAELDKMVSAGRRAIAQIVAAQKRVLGWRK